MYGCALEGLEVVEMDGAREAETFEFTLDLGREEGFACWECDAAGSGGKWRLSISWSCRLGSQSV